MTKHSNPAYVAVTLEKSLSGRKQSHQACAKGIGLRKIRQRILVRATPENMGMINEIRYLVSVEENVTCD
ncbi:MAG: 50S ribosomal protein L30 [Pseudomonadota bacterium]